MTDSERTKYDIIYSIVTDRLAQKGIKFEYNLETFLKDIGEPPGTVTVSNYTELPNDKFFQAIHVRTERKLPDKTQSDKWSQYASLPKEDFQIRILKELERSRFVAINHIRFVNNPYFEQSRGLGFYFWGKMYGLTDKPSLRAFCRKLPEPVQNIIKKVFL